MAMAQDNTIPWSIPKIHSLMCLVLYFSFFSSNSVVLATDATALASSPVPWVLATESILKEYLFPYEYCLLQKSHLLDQSKSMFLQDICPQDEGYQNISLRCKLGSIQQHLPGGLCMLEAWGCTPLWKRLGFWKYFSGLPVPHGNGDALLRSISKSGFSLVRFFGDSMSIQIGQHLACRYERKMFLDYIRNPTRYKAPPVQLDPSYFSMSGQSCIGPLFPNTPTICMYRPLWAIGTLTHDSKRYRMQLPMNCTDLCALDYARQRVYETTTRSLLIGKRWTSSVIILPLPIIKKNPEEWIPFCRALIEQALRLKSFHIHIVVLSSLAQHFPTPDGLYSREALETVNHVPREYLCPPLYPPADEPDNPNFLKTMDRLYSPWRSVIGYVNIRNFSFPHHDMHGEYKATGFMFDCTHYAYSPFLMEATWVALTEYFSKFSLSKFVNSRDVAFKPPCLQFSDGVVC